MSFPVKPEIVYLYFYAPWRVFEVVSKYIIVNMIDLKIALFLKVSRFFRTTRYIFDLPIKEIEIYVLLPVKVLYYLTKIICRFYDFLMSITTN